MVQIFCERLKELRQEKDLSTRQLAKEINVSHVSISKWECGFTIPTIENLLALAKYFDVSADYLLGLEDFA